MRSQPMPAWSALRGPRRHDPFLAHEVALKSPCTCKPPCPCRPLSRRSEASLRECGPGYYISSFNLDRGMSGVAAAYQSKATGVRRGCEYRVEVHRNGKLVDAANFDGYLRPARKGVPGQLLDAKAWAPRGLPMQAVEVWNAMGTRSSGRHRAIALQIMEEARRQVRVAAAHGGVGVAWLVLDPTNVEPLQTFLDRALGRRGAIQVRYRAP